MLSIQFHHWLMPDREFDEIGGGQTIDGSWNQPSPKVHFSSTATDHSSLRTA